MAEPAPRSTDRDYTAGPVRCIGGLSRCEAADTASDPHIAGVEIVTLDARAGQIFLSGKLEAGNRNLVTPGTPLAGRTPEHERCARQRIAQVIEDVPDLVARQDNSAAARAREVDQIAIAVAVARATATSNDKWAGWLHRDNHLIVRRAGLYIMPGNGPRSGMLFSCPAYHTPDGDVPKPVRSARRLYIVPTVGGRNSSSQRGSGIARCPARSIGAMNLFRNRNMRSRGSISFALKVALCAGIDMRPWRVTFLP